MAKKILWIGSFVMVLVFGMMVIGCDIDDDKNGDKNGSPNLNGTWTKGINTMVIAGSNFTYLVSGVNSYKGTVVFTGTTSGNFTINYTHYWADDDWVTMAFSENGTWSLSGNVFTIGGLISTGAENVNGDWIKQTGNNENGSPNFDGTWTKGINTMVIAGSNFTFLVSEVNSYKGTVTFTGTTSGNFTINYTHYWADDDWVTMTFSENGTWSLAGNVFTIGGLISTGAENVNGNWTKQ